MSIGKSKGEGHHPYDREIKRHISGTMALIYDNRQRCGPCTCDKQDTCFAANGLQGKMCVVVILHGAEAALDNGGL